MKIKMNKDEIKKIIPHREPMLLLTEVTKITEGESLNATFEIDSEWNIFDGHFPDDPVVPGVYLVECMAQASDVLILSMGRYSGTIPYFIGIDKVKFKAKVKPGDIIDIETKIVSERQEKGIVTCSAVIYNNGEESAAGDVTLAMRKGKP